MEHLALRKKIQAKDGDQQAQSRPEQAFSSQSLYNNLTL
jgi:hypothetical protein